jgi:hypothetical protein
MARDNKVATVLSKEWMYRKVSRSTLAVLLAVTLLGSLAFGGGVVAQHSSAVQTQGAPAQEVPTQEVPAQNTTYLRVMHASPDAPAVDVYINETMPMNDSVDNESASTNDSVDNESASTNDSVDNESASTNDSVDNESSLMSVTLTNVSFSNVSEYMALEAGNYTVTITAAGDRDAVIFEDTVTLDAGAVTTLVASDVMPDNASEVESPDNATDGDWPDNATDGETPDNATDGETPDNASKASGLLMYDDNAFRPAENDSAIRIVHLSPDAPTVDVTTANGTVLADGLSFHESSGYMTVPAGDYEVQIRADTPDQNGTVVATVNVSVENGSAHSAMAIGYLNATDEQVPFEVALIEDATQTVHLPGDSENESEMNETRIRDRSLWG